MRTIPFEALQAYRAHTFRSAPGLRITSKEEAVEWVNQRGLVYFWPIKDSVFPSLWAAVAGDRPVADAHDDPGHVTWGWKDSLLGGRDWYYAKVLRKKGTMIAFPVAAYFYALTENYGDPESDHLTQYEQGRLTLEAKTLYEALLTNGPLDTIALRKAARLTSPGSEARFNRAISDLQADFKITPVAVTQAGAWHYAFAYDITARHYPDLPEAARQIDENQARQALANLYLQAIGAARPADMTRLFGWKAPLVAATLANLDKHDQARLGFTLENHPGEWAVSTALLG